MKLRDRMVYAGIVMSDLKRRHPAHVREFYRDLLHVCDDTGRFEANARDLRSVLFAPILNRVSERDVQGYLQALHVAGDIKLYTVMDRGFGKVTKWRQLRLKRKVQEFPDESGEMELPLADSTGDPPSLEKEGRKEGSVSRKRSRAPLAPGHTHAPLLAEENLEALRSEWPEHDMQVCLRRAQKYVHRVRGADARVALDWFREHWMPNEPKSQKRKAEAILCAEPINFQEWYLERYEMPASKAWLEMTDDQRAYFLKQMGAAAKFAPQEGAA